MYGFSAYDYHADAFHRSAIQLHDVSCDGWDVGPQHQSSWFEICSVQAGLTRDYLLLLLPFQTQPLDSLPLTGSFD